MLNLSCLCGQVQIKVCRRPDFINECNCNACSKSGARWGYFHPDDVTVEGTTTGYSREDKAEPSAEIRFCPKCGSTTHFTLTPSTAEKFGNTMMGVNLWLASESDLMGVELRFPDGRSWPGEGEFGYVREARILGE